MTDALAIRKAEKSKKPNFKRQDYNHKVKLGQAWRKPKGKHSKVRLCRDGHQGMARIGWGSPRAASGLHPSGLQPIIVSALSDIASLDEKIHGAVLSRTVGTKKKLALVEELGKKKITILNIAKDFKESVEKDLASRKERKKGISKKRDVKKEEKKETKKPEKKELTEEEKHDEQRKEAEKVLTQKER